MFEGRASSSGGAQRVRGDQALVQQRGGVEHRLAHVEHGLEDLVLDLDQLERVLGDVRVAGADGGDGVTAEQHLLVRHQMRDHRIERLLPAHRERVHPVARVGEVGEGDRGLHAGQGQRRGDVDALHEGVRVRAALDPAVEHPGEPEVHSVLRPTGHLLDPVVPDGPRADRLVTPRSGHHPRTSSRPARTTHGAYPTGGPGVPRDRRRGRAAAGGAHTQGSPPRGGTAWRSTCAQFLARGAVLMPLSISSRPWTNSGTSRSLTLRQTRSRRGRGELCSARRRSWRRASPRQVGP